MNFKLRNRNSKILALLVAVLFLFSFFPGYGLAEDVNQPSNLLMEPVTPPTDVGEVPGENQGSEEPGTNPQGTLENPDDTSSDNQQGTLEEPDKKEGEDPEKTPQEELPLIPVIAEKVSLTIHHVLDLGEGKEKLTYTDTIDDLDSRATVKGSDYQVCEEGIAFVGSEPEELVLGDGDNEITLLYNPNLPVVGDQDEQEEFIPENPDGLSEFSTGITPAKPFYYPSSPRMMMRAMPLANNGLQPGEVRLSKEAAPVTDTENRWTVTLSIEGKGKSQTSDVVLVIDKSGSMKGKKMDNTISAAQAFAEQLLQPNDTTRIAVVAFDGDYHLIENFTGYVGKEALKAKIAAIQASGATNIQAGIHQAQILLDGSTASNKSMVVLGDGEPTYSYQVDGASGITLKSCSLGTPTIIYDNPQITSCNYGSIVGSGSSYELDQKSRYQIPCPYGIFHSSHATTFPANNGIPTIYEAGLAKASGINIYSVALQAGKNGEYVLNQCQNSGYYPLNSSDLSGLNAVFNQIAGKIALAASNGVVVDPIGDMFELVLIGNVSPKVSQGDFTVNSDNGVPNRIINWNVGDILDGQVATLTYIVQIKPEASPNVDYPTNGTTTFTYYNEVTEENGSDDFDVPQVQITKPVYTVEFEAGANGSLIGTTSFEDILEGTAWAAAVTVPTPVANPGYKFDKWTPAFPKTITASVTYTANFVKDPSQWHTVTFVSDGKGSFEAGDQTEFKDILEGTAWSDAVTVPTTVANPGYKFDRWTPPFPSTVTKSQTYTAKFVKDPSQWHTVTFVSGGNGTLSGTTSFSDILNGTAWAEAVTVPETTPAAGYKFSNWDPAFPETVTGSVTYTANFAKDETQWHTVTFAAGVNGSLTGTTSFSDILTGTAWADAVTVPETIPAAGYKFSNWDPALPGANDKVTEDMTFTAIFARTGGGGGGTTSPTTPSEVVVEPEAPLVSLNKEDHYGYMVGYPDGTFQPEGNITREEVATVFYKLLNADHRQSVTTNVNNFSDVATDRWSSTPISTLAAVNIITGYPDGTFKPGGSITRAELATVASKFDKLSPFESNQFSDIIGHWANNFINSAAQKGWVRGYEDGTFRPERAITRAEFATLVNNVLDRRVRKEDILPDAIQFKDLSPDAWHYEACQEAVNSHYYERENSSDFEKWTELYEFSITW